MLYIRCALYLWFMMCFCNELLRFILRYIVHSNMCALSLSLALYIDAVVVLKFIEVSLVLDMLYLCCNANSVQGGEETETPLKAHVSLTTEALFSRLMCKRDFCKINLFVKGLRGPPHPADRVISKLCRRPCYTVFLYIRSLRRNLHHFWVTTIVFTNWHTRTHALSVSRTGTNLVTAVTRGRKGYG